MRARQLAPTGTPLFCHALAGRVNHFEGLANKRVSVWPNPLVGEARAACRGIVSGNCVAVDSRGSTAHHPVASLSQVPFCVATGDRRNRCNGQVLSLAFGGRVSRKCSAEPAEGRTCLLGQMRILSCEIALCANVWTRQRPCQQHHSYLPRCYPGDIASGGTPEERVPWTNSSQNKDLEEFGPNNPQRRARTKRRRNSKYSLERHPAQRRIPSISYRTKEKEQAKANSVPKYLPVYHHPRSLLARPGASGKRHPGRQPFKAGIAGGSVSIGLR
ncbi:hypothetical protein B0T25DRAFT_329941 [Lasiosphaeria hispida]|uniref:Uncharacterized protein n=1 Tax=Lasiosphaeria hispida TaxID=260671 RepID=A0AAJ0H5Q2_9PEZI|nr:hypothetical protein B0T25DRAFT_329941 [Lasiosphaeria hispida]